MAQKNMDLVRGLYEAFGRGDGAAVLAAMDAGIEWNEAENFPYADGNPYIGPMAVAAGVFQRIGEDWEFWSLDIEQMLDAGDNIVALGRYKSQHKRTGAPLDCQFAHIWWLRDGKVVRFQQYADTAQARGACGLR